MTIAGLDLGAAGSLVTTQASLPPRVTVAQAPNDRAALEMTASRTAPVMEMCN